LYWWIFIPLFLVVISGCANRVATSHQFHVISEDELRGEMLKLADYIGEVADITVAEETTLHIQRDRIIPLLNNIASVASGLGGGQVVTNYSVINYYMGAFLYDVSVALKFAYKNPPNIVPAGRLINSCLACHRSF
jgi:hypothetical protein